MKSNDLELSPCPFCGSNDLLVTQWIECNGCGAFGPTPGEDGDMSSWNNRHGYNAVDMATAAAQGFRDGQASVVVELPGSFLQDYVNKNEVMDAERVIEAIIAAGGKVKE